MKINWGKLLDEALDAGVHIAKTELWINEKIEELSDVDTEGEALVEIAYQIALMDNDTWNYLKFHLDIKAGKNQQAKYMLSYCNYAVSVENKVRGLLSQNLQDAFDVLKFDFHNGMEFYERAAHYGVLAAFSQNNPKANSLTSAFGKLLNSGR